MTHFTSDIDYKLKKTATATAEAGDEKKLGGAGQNKEIIMLNINTCKLLIHLTHCNVINVMK